MDRFCSLYFMLVCCAVVSVHVALWSPGGKGLTPWLWCLLCFVTFPNVSWSTLELRARLAPLNWFKPSSKMFYCTKAVRLLWIFYVFVLSCVCYVLCASVYMCFVVTCWERVDLLALVCGVFCEFVTFPLVSWVRCGT